MFDDCVPATASGVFYRPRDEPRPVDNYNKLVKTILKSAAFALAGTGLFFSFFMMLSIAALNVIARLQSPNAPLQAPDVVLGTGPWFRIVGLSLSAIIFATGFVLAMKRFRKTGDRPSAIGPRRVGG